MAKSVASIDKKGRLLIPQSLRDAMNIRDGEKVILELDEKNGGMSISPAHEKRLLKLSIMLGDSPGSLASAATALSKLGVDFVSTQSHSARRGEAAIWEVECNPRSASIPRIKTSVKRSGAKVLSAKWE